MLKNRTSTGEVSLQQAKLCPFSSARTACVRGVFLITNLGNMPRIFQNLENISHVFGLCVCEEYSYSDGNGKVERRTHS